MTTNKNILYIGPYNEESTRGRYSLNNIRALIKAGYNLKTVPISYYGTRFKPTPEDLLVTEQSDYDYYDINIQHCDIMQFCYDGRYGKNIGIYTPVDKPEDPIINTRLALLDNIVVNSKKTKNALRQVLVTEVNNKVHYSPKYIDFENVDTTEKIRLDWIDKNRYYFYAEVEFTQSYDWEKIVFVYATHFANKNCGLVLKTYDIKNEEQLIAVEERIESICIEANVQPSPETKPQILTGIYNNDQAVKVLNSMDCIIDACKTYDYNDNIILAASLGKSIIANRNLPASTFLKTIIPVESHKCNMNINMYNDIISSGYSEYRTMDNSSLRDAMSHAHITEQYQKEDIHDQDEIQQYDISNIDKLLCL